MGAHYAYLLYYTATSSYMSYPRPFLPSVAANYLLMEPCFFPLLSETHFMPPSFTSRIPSSTSRPSLYSSEGEGDVDWSGETPMG